MSSGDRSAAAGTVLAACALLAMPARAQLDLAALEVIGQRGQSAEQTRRDRYECHNWAVEQTDFVPTAAPREAPGHEERARRAERIDRVLGGAAIGAGIGGLVRATQDRNPAHGVLAGAAVGAAVGAATGRTREGPAPSERESDYLRALSACLEGRGYAVALPAPEGVVAEQSR
jgi:hypothetical protein